MVINHLVEYRRKLGFSQEQLAELCGIGHSTISQIETGKYIPNIETALLLAEAIGVPVDDLFSLKK